jgi:hypothetical protein
MTGSVREELFSIIYDVGEHEARVLLKLPISTRRKIMEARRQDNIKLRETDPELWAAKHGADAEAVRYIENALRQANPPK